MRFFQEVEIAKVCYAREAVSWIVQGLVPSFVADDYGNEIRGSLRAYRNEFFLEPSPLTPSEVSHFAVDMSYDEYLMAAYGWGLPDEIPPTRKTDTVTEIAMETVEAMMAEWKEQRNARDAENRANLSKALFKFDHEVERARAKVLAALVDGRIALTGYWFGHRDDLDAGEETEAGPERIPADLVSPSLFDWNSDTLQTFPSADRPAGAYHLITMDTRAMLATFNSPPGDTLSVRINFGNAILDGKSEQPPTAFSAQSVHRRGPGRPPKADWLRTGMRAWYGAQCSMGKLGLGKVEADLSAAQAWAASAGCNVSRTTVQTYLSGLLRNS